MVSKHKLYVIQGNGNGNSEVNFFLRMYVIVLLGIQLLTTIVNQKFAKIIEFTPKFLSAFLSGKQLTKSQSYKRSLVLKNYKFVSNDALPYLRSSL